MSPSAAVRSVLSQYATFSGRARRSEYWWWVLAANVLVLVVYGVVGVVGAVAGTDGAALPVLGVLAVLVLLGLALPTIAVTVRRLHDTGRSGWWYLLSLVPFGSIVIIVFTCLESTPGTNAHGPSPHQVGYDTGRGALA